MKLKLVLCTTLLTVALQAADKSGTRLAQVKDLDSIVGLVMARVKAQQKADPAFFKPSEEAQLRLRLLFKDQLGAPGSILLVHQTKGSVDGFAFGRLDRPSQVLDTGGPMLILEELLVSKPELYPSLGKELLIDVRTWAKARDARLVRMVCDNPNDALRALLNEMGMKAISAMHIGELD